MKTNKIRPMGNIRILDEKGMSYIPVIVRRELGVEGKDQIPFYINANCVLLVRKGASKEDVIKGLEILKGDIELRSIEEPEESAGE